MAKKKTASPKRKMDHSELDRELNAKTVGELRSIARLLRIAGRSRTTKKDELVTLILKQDETRVRRVLKATWWDRYHHHVYGVATLLALVLALFFWLFPRQHDSSQGEDGRLSIVDLDILEAGASEDNQFPKMDVVLRNTGNVAVITQAIFHVRAVYEAKARARPGALEPTWNYDVRLPILGAPTNVVVDVRQEVPSDGSDRFQFTLGNDAPPTLSSFLFEISVEFVYDEDKKRLHSKPILFIATPAIELLGVTDKLKDDLVCGHVHNLKVIRLFEDFQGIVSEATKAWMDGNQVSHLVAKFEEGDVKKRRYLADYFGKLGYEGRDALPILREATNDSDRELSDAARVAIASIESAKLDTTRPEIDPEIHDKIKALNLNGPFDGEVR